MSGSGLGAAGLGAAGLGPTMPVMTGRDVRVRYTKYDGSLHWHFTMRYLGADAHGVWLGAPAGSTTQRGAEPPIVFDAPAVLLIPEGVWWTATFHGEPARVDLYCDVGTPPQWPDSDEVTMADLDLDVLRVRADGHVLIDDEDEFAAHQVRYQYPAEVISEAERATAWLVEVISGGAEPFATEYRAWLDKVS